MNGRPAPMWLPLALLMACGHGPRGDSVTPTSSSSEATAPKSCLEFVKAWHTNPSGVATTDLFLICGQGDDQLVEQEFAVMKKEIETADMKKTGLGLPMVQVPLPSTGCRLERICGTMGGIDCHSSVDGPYDYFDFKSWRRLANCGGNCMGGDCEVCPPEGWSCETY